MNKYIAYFRTVLRHKWFVFLACLEMGVPLWAAIIHDWDKFLPAMARAYAERFDGRGKGIWEDEALPEDVLLAFNRAWNGHQKLNKHHWQYWQLEMDSGKTVFLPMPERHWREMIADWMGAGRAYKADWTPLSPMQWYQQNRIIHATPRLHPETQKRVEFELELIALRYQVKQQAKEAGVKLR